MNFMPVLFVDVSCGSRSRRRSRASAQKTVRASERARKRAIFLRARRAGTNGLRLAILRRNTSRANCEEGAEMSVLELVPRRSKALEFESSIGGAAAADVVALAGGE